MESAAQVIQAGVAPKLAEGQLTVNFPKVFSTIPTVVLTAYFMNNSPTPVSSVETLYSVSTDSFVLTSNNYGPNYSVSWVAIGT